MYDDFLRLCDFLDAEADVSIVFWNHGWRSGYSISISQSGESSLLTMKRIL